MRATRSAQLDTTRAGHEQTVDHIDRSRRWRRRSVGLAGTFATAATLALTGLSGAAHAELVPCDPLDCPTGPVYAPEQIAVGLDRDFDTAADEAETQAAATCSYDHTYDVVRVRAPQRPGGRWEYTLTYRCHSPLYDPWP